ncbi:MAG: prepilin-type N-terminal cleavage/methylation domain-containing protein, partial [Planctomycetota bacterium]
MGRKEPMNGTNSDRRAFTLVEILVSLSIFLVLGSML